MILGYVPFGIISICFLRFARTYYYCAKNTTNYINMKTNMINSPPICVIIPVKLITCKSSNIQECWKSHLTSTYTGSVEFIFVIEQNNTYTLSLINDVIKNVKDNGMSLLNARVIISGPCQTSSQKIHNMLAGVRQCSPNVKYIQFLDISYQIHLHTYENNIYTLETNVENNIFLVSGCPLDVPVSNSSIWSWVLCQFRHSSIVGEFYQPYNGFVWGGHMCIRKSDIDIGTCLYRRLMCSYSDDMTIQNYGLEKGLRVIVPAKNIFLNRVRNNFDIYDIWNFLRRQCFAITQFHTIQGLCHHIILYLCMIVCHSSMFYTTLTILYYSIYHPIYALFICIGLLLTVYMERCMVYQIYHCISFSSVIYIPFIRYLSSLLLLSPLLLLAGIVTLYTPTITWGNINYTRSFGCIQKTHNKYS
jgi:hypothetical protein